MGSGIPAPLLLLALSALHPIIGKLREPLLILEGPEPGGIRLRCLPEPLPDVRVLWSAGSGRNGSGIPEPGGNSGISLLLRPGLGNAAACRALRRGAAAESAVLIAGEASGKREFCAEWEKPGLDGVVRGFFFGIFRGFLRFGKVPNWAGWFSVGSGRSRDGIPDVFFPSPSPWLPAFILLLLLALCLALAAALRLRKSHQEISEETEELRMELEEVTGKSQREKMEMETRLEQIQAQLDFRRAQSHAVSLSLDECCTPPALLIRGPSQILGPDPGSRPHPQALAVAQEGFSCGKHYWEVELGDGSAWELGVLREEVRDSLRDSLRDPIPNSTPDSLQDSTLDPILNSISNSILDSIPNSTPKSILDPIPDSLRDPIPDPIPDSLQDSIPDPILNSIPDPTLDPIPNSIMDPIPDPIPNSIPDPIPNSILDPIPNSIMDPIPDPIPNSIPDPILDPIPNSMPDPIPNSIQDPIPNSILDPIPDPIPNPIPDPIMDPIPDPIPNSIPDPIPNPIPNSITDPIPDPIPNPIPNSIPDPLRDDSVGDDSLPSIPEEAAPGLQYSQGEFRLPGGKLERNFGRCRVLGVLLDQERRVLEFFDAEEKQLLGSLPLKISGNLFPFFRPGSGGNSLGIRPEAAPGLQYSQGEFRLPGGKLERNFGRCRVLGVLLDQERRVLEFFDAEEKQLLGSLPLKISGNLFPFFRPGSGGNSLGIRPPAPEVSPPPPAGAARGLFFLAEGAGRSVPGGPMV
ncbi:uncharacterized protein LOC121337850 [Onychostruthus taczanowskii]|uniref:uncharacterized protein LOC121337850 n=1 Tax=Onychostruthus taczanowskii TaxID=356909 RepID=UPI001B806861|nr:uncharacterized protein LOC121337850 [Onychostruthus taczanowskii]